MIGKQRYPLNPVDTTDSAGQAIRYWLPPNPTGPLNLIIWGHPDSQTQLINPGYWAYPLIHSFIQEGWAVVGSNLHNRSWGNAASLTDVVNEYNFMQSLIGVDKIVFAGGSMGALSSLLTISNGSLPDVKVKGAALIDGVTNLANLYSLGTYTTVIDTAFAISGDYSAKTAGYDPMLKSAASYAGKRYRFYASAADSSVPRANNADAFNTLVTGQALECSVQTHLLGHLDTHGVWPKDMVAFIKRCFA